MTEFSQSRFSKIISSINPTQLLGIGGFAAMGAAMLLSLNLPPEQSLTIAAATLLSNLGLNVISGKIQGILQNFSDAPSSDETYRFEALARNLQEEIRSNDEFQKEMSKFLGEFKAFEIARETLKGNLAITNWLVTQTYSDVQKSLELLNDLKSEHHKTHKLLSKSDEKRDEQHDAVVDKLDQILAYFGNNKREIPFTVPNLPSHFVERPKEFNQLVSLLLDKNKQNPVAITTALQGGGGFGKTTLAIALCHDEVVRAAFNDGILWLQFRENTTQNDVLTLLNQQILLLTPSDSAYIDIMAAAARFRELLQDRHILIALDDVWQEHYLRHFIQEGTAYLITTRLQTVVTMARAEKVLVDELATSEAAALLAKWLDAPPSAAEQTLLVDLAQRLGEWAVLLELVGAELRSLMDAGRLLTEAVAYVVRRFEKHGMTYLNRDNENERNLSISLSLDASVLRLKPNVQTRFYELAIFPEDTDISFDTIEQLWGATANFDAVDSEDALEAISRLSLFTRYDARLRIVRLHDVIRKVILERLDNAATVHTKLVDAWGELTDLPDIYAWNNLAYHLVSANRSEQLRQLLTQDKTWMDKKFDVTKTDLSCLNDIDYAIRTFRDPLDGQALLELICLYSARYVIFERTHSIIDTELKILVWQGEESRALQYAQQRKDPNALVKGLRAVYLAKRHRNETDLELLEKISDVASQIPDVAQKAHALITVADDLFELGRTIDASRLVDDVISLIGKIENRRDYYGPWIRRRLCIIFVKMQSFEQAHNELENIQDYETFVDATIEMAQEYEKLHMRGKVVELAERALEEARAYTVQDDKRVRTSKKIAEAVFDLKLHDLIETTIKEFEDFARVISQGSYQSPFHYLGEVAILLFRMGKVSDFQRIIEDIRKSGHETAAGVIARAYALIADYTLAMQTARALPPEGFRGSWIRKEISKILIEYGQFSEAEQLIVEIGVDRLKAEALERLAYFQAKAGQFEKAQQALQSMKDAKFGEREDRSIPDVQLECVSAFLAAGEHLAASKLAFSMEGNLEKLKAYHLIALYYSRANMIDKYHEMLLEADGIIKNKDFERKEDAQADRAWVYLLTDKFDEADDIISRLSGQYHNLYTWLCRTKIRILADKGEFQRAEQALMNTSWGGPSDELVHAYCVLAIYTYRSHQTDTAQKYFKKALDVARRIVHSPLIDYSASAFYNISEAYASLSLFHEAEAVLESISEPTRSSAKRFICERMALSQKYLEAEKLARSIEVEGVKALALGLIASEFQNNGNLGKAESLYQEAELIIAGIDKDKDRAVASRYLEIAYIRSKQFTKALECIQVQSINEYIKELATGRDAFNEIDETMSYHIVKEAIRIAAWNNSTWVDISNRGI